MWDPKYNFWLETMTASTASNDWSWIRIIVQTVSVLIIFQYILFPALSQSYGIRLYALKEYGNVIHEFDPYFNFRATVYLDEHGWSKFVRWFDYKSWYPLGRPVGTTIYPGMQITSVLIHKYLLPDWSINDICCFVPAWFGVTATLAVAALTWNCTSGQGQSGSILWDIPVVKQLYQYTVLPLVNAIWKIFTRISLSSWGFPDTLLLTPREHGGTSNSISDTSIVTPLVSASVAAWIMSIVPAHLLRSVGGGYDNESVAMTAMVMTFACWTRSLQASASPRLWGVLTGLAYGYMVAAWGGYTFVLNLIGVHATFLVLLGRFSHKLYLSYSCFYIVGTLVAVQVPVVGWSPIRSLEQVGPLLAFIGIQLMQIVEYLRVKRGIKTAFQLWKLRVLVFGGGAVALVVLAMALYPTGYFGPISSRVRGLFVKHTKTGNPLVDSVAEHQAASPEAYFQYLHYASFLAPIGFLITTFYDWDDASSFLFVYAIAAYFFSHKMVRLILLTAPIASCLAGIAVGRLVGYAYWMMMGAEVNIFALVEGDHERTLAQEERAPDTTLKSIDSAKAKTKKSQKAKKKNATAADTTPPAMYSRIVVVSLLGYLAMKSIPIVEEFRDLCHEMAKQISHPTIIQKAQTRDGRVVVVDDYREAYFWLRDNTPEDARIMAWWDYGYQITGIANRTTIADGNTWNHEHIALLGRTLTAPEKEGHRIARHLADYVLVWAGGGGDDLAKSPHLRRIANSVYRGLCREPTCREFGFVSSDSEWISPLVTYDANSHTCTVYRLRWDPLKT